MIQRWEAPLKRAATRSFVKTTPVRQTTMAMVTERSGTSGWTQTLSSGRAVRTKSAVIPDIAPNTPQRIPPNGSVSLKIQKPSSAVPTGNAMMPLCAIRSVSAQRPKRSCAQMQNLSRVLQWLSAVRIVRNIKAKSMIVVAVHRCPLVKAGVTVLHYPASVVLFYVSSALSLKIIA